MGRCSSKAQIHLSALFMDIMLWRDSSTGAEGRSESSTNSLNPVPEVCTTKVFLAWSQTALLSLLPEETTPLNLRSTMLPRKPASLLRLAAAAVVFSLAMTVPPSVAVERSPPLKR